jgi:general secretion pathway protein B
MSYILEALKKSQSDRELGQVPRVEGFGIDVPIEPPRNHPWAYVALLLALLAVGAMVFVLLRGWGGLAGVGASPDQTLAPPGPQHEDRSGVGVATIAAAPAAPPIGTVGARQPTSGAGVAAGADAHAGGGGAPLSETAPVPPAPLPITAATPRPLPTPPSAVADAVPPAADPPPAAQGAPAGGLTLEDPDNLSVEPQVLVVPAPAKPGEPLPRGAEELRRAVLGGGERLSASVDGSAALPAPPPPDVPLPSAPPDNDQVPVPDDLLAEIEAFKELVRKQDPSVAKRAAAAPPPLPEPPGLELLPATETVALPPGPSLDLRNRLPPFSMNVHVFNDDPKRRFVYINGRKLTEKQESPEGLRLERIVADGAVLSFDGERFFQRR